MSWLIVELIVAMSPTMSWLIVRVLVPRACCWCLEVLLCCGPESWGRVGSGWDCWWGSARGVAGALRGVELLCGPGALRAECSAGTGGSAGVPSTNTRAVPNRAVHTRAVHNYKRAVHNKNECDKQKRKSDAETKE